MQKFKWWIWKSLSRFHEEQYNSFYISLKEEKKIGDQFLTVANIYK